MKIKCTTYQKISVVLQLISGVMASQTNLPADSIERNARDIYALIEGINLSKPAYVGWSLAVAIWNTDGRTLWKYL